jgi:N-ethylmaleimide reductase
LTPGIDTPVQIGGWRKVTGAVQAVAAVAGPDRVGVRFTSLFSSTDEERVYPGFAEDNPHRTYIEAIQVLEDAGIAYLSIAEADWDNAPELPMAFRHDVRKTFSGRIIYAGRYTADPGTRPHSSVSIFRACCA